MQSIADRKSSHNGQGAAAVAAAGGAGEPTEVEQLRLRNDKLAALFGRTNALFDAWDTLTKAGQYAAARITDSQLEAARAELLLTLGSGLA